MTDQRDVQQMIQGLTPSAVNNGNPNTVYNQPGPQGGYIPPTFDQATNTWRINPSKPATPVNWQQMSMGQPQPTSSWNFPRPTVPPGTGVPPATPVPNPIPQPVLPPAPTTTVDPTSQTPGYDTWKRRQDPNFVYGESHEAACVVVDSFLVDYDRAGDVQVGDSMTVINATSFRRSQGKVSYSETKTVPCVRITTETGVMLDCSATAPIADETGEQVLATDLLNKLVPVCVHGAYFLDRVTSVEDLGELEVQHITAEDNFFLAGKEKGRYIFHHNMKMVEGTGMDLLGMRENRDRSYGGWSEGGGGGVPTMDRVSNTRGAMQRDGSWYQRPGVAQPNVWNGSLTPGAAAWDGSMAPTPAAPATDFLKEFSTATDPLSMYKSANAWLAGSAGGSNVSTWNSTAANLNPYQSAIGGINEQPYSSQSVSNMPWSEDGISAKPVPTDGGGWWDSAKHVGSMIGDALLPGNQYHADDRKWASPTSIGLSIFDLIAGGGGVVSEGIQRYGESELKRGYNPQAQTQQDAVFQMKYAYQQTPPDQRGAAVAEMQKQGYNQQVIDMVTGQ